MEILINPNFYSQKHAQTGKYTFIITNLVIYIEIHKDRKIYTHTNINIFTDKARQRQTINMQTNIKNQTHSQTDKNTNTHRQKHTHTVAEPLDVFFCGFMKSTCRVPGDVD